MDSASFFEVVDTLAAPEMEGRDAGSAGLGRARDYLVDRFIQQGLEPAFMIDGRPSYTQPFELRTGADADGKPITAVVENVGALLPGVGALADEVVVVGAHYDHVGYGRYGTRSKESRGKLHPGADDNASGTAATVLLPGELLARFDPKMPRRTVLFTCFAGEERGLHGSRYMTRNQDQWAFDGGRVVGMINLDMIGRLRDDRLYVFTDKTGAQWRDWINQANQYTRLDLQWDVRPPGGSDHSLFIAAGIPAVFFNTWLHDDYHTPNDTADKINAEGGERVTRLVAALTYRVATDPDRLVFVKPKPRAFLGVSLRESEAGVVVGGLSNNGPMQQAGAKAGDVIVSIAGVEMAGVPELQNYLYAKAKAGSEAVVVVRRGEERLELTVKLGSRPGR